MNKKEFIKRLIDMGGCGAKPGTWARGWDGAISGVIEIAEELDEPAKVVIPQFVANEIERYEDMLDMLSGEYFNNSFEEIDDDGLLVWIDENQDTFARAWLDGYEVEKEPRWVVKIGKGYFSGYNETKVTYVLDNFPGEIARRIVYDDLNEAESDANDIGGEVEEVTE